VILLGLTVAGAVGSVLRYAVDQLVQRRGRSDFPSGILVVNISGSLLLGAVIGSSLHHGVSPYWVTVAGTGLIGAYTTFSTFSFDTYALLERGRWRPALANVVVSLAAGLGAAALGLVLGSLT
jgi:fluoride exporter